ncbi:hypothetical protein D0C36_18490 [Mucilaginibacter conchicola]|uniref:APCDD1 domain-containing protein n=1 Tax=Mucilaginibacter conchicola TaxID=2303333 RepID=A0A372NRE6_9SPHI|nr:hypothetical protein [Mucilaginibacter conchicola]RFZ90935.1 hypothetical protein D0C36_18490 [Mucilaginibacter conchicola]
MPIEQVKEQAIGLWQSIAVEVRPSLAKNADGSLKPFYLTRAFELWDNDEFNLTIINYADPFGKTALAKLFIHGRMLWQGAHDIAEGAQKVDFAANIDYQVTPLYAPFAFVLNQATKGFEEWKVNGTQSIFKKAFPPFGLAEGDVFKEFDLIYLSDGLMFWGARNVDGRGFGTEEDRPTNLQIPLRRADNF